MLGGLGGQLTVTAVMLHMYALTSSTLAVAMIAFAGLVPMIFAGLYGGMLSDYFDRRRVALISATITWIATVSLATVAWTGHVNEAWLYGLSIVISCSNSVVSAAKTAMTPKLVGPELIAPAAALNGISIGIMVMAGPAAGGALVALLGYPLTYTIDVLLMLSLFLGLWTLPRLLPGGVTTRPGLESLRDGLRFLRTAPNLRAQFFLDIIAMVFGSPVAIFPAVGVVLLGGGEITTGILTAAVAIGTFLSSLVSGRLSGITRHGIAITRAVQAFGLATMLFGLALLGAHLGWFAPETVDATHPNVVMIVAACIALALTGASDNISSIFRSTMMQQATPDVYRGRLQGIFMTVVTSGPRLGALYFGVLASLFTLWVPAVAGGLMIMAIAGVLLRLRPGFGAYDSRHPQP